VSEAETLARQARQVAAAFGRLPAEEAARAVAAHINQFWAPALRRSFLAAAPGMELPEAVRRALDLVRPPGQ
jgi:formate dehydrogenase subunit delta